MLKLVLFDVDGTLLHTSGAGRRAIHAALAEEFGTPLVVYCEETLRAAARAYRTGAPDAVIVYGTKAFPNVAIMRLLAEEGVGADVSTLGELRFAQRAEVPAERIVVHGNNKSDEELAAAAAADVWLVVMDEPGELERMVAILAYKD